MTEKVNINIAYEDTKLNIISLLNNSGLPFVCMRAIINEIKTIIDDETKSEIKRLKGVQNE